MNSIKKSVFSILFAAFVGSLIYFCWDGYSWYKLRKENIEYLNIDIYSRNIKQTESRELAYRKILELSLSFVVMLSILGMIAILHFNKRTNWWKFSIAFSLLFLSEILLFWLITSNRAYHRWANLLVITQPQEVEAYLKEENTGQKYKTIPTGIIINRLSFCKQSNSVFPGTKVSGYVWQHFTKGIHDDVERAIRFPSMSSSGVIEKLFTKKTDDGEIICWHFQGDIHQRFELKYFPFDHRYVKIHILPKSFSDNVICIPDLKAYDGVPSNHLGIRPEVEIVEWSLDKSFFSYKSLNFGSNFDIPNFKSKTYPDFHFYIIASRHFWETFIQYMLIILLAALLSFATLMSTDKQKRFLGFSSISTLGAISGILFILTASHINMRNALDVEGSIYLDYLYFTSYLFGLLVAFNAVWFAITPEPEVPHHNLLAKVLFWPLYLCSVLCTTVIFFM